MMQNRHILLTAFCGTSAEQLLENVTACTVLLLPNDKVKDSELLIQALQREAYSHVISVGQRPNIKDKIHIETCAREGTRIVHSNLDCHDLLSRFEDQGISCKLSGNAGTSFCNQLYWNTLRYLSENEKSTKMVFIHVPFRKNISDFENFRHKILNVILEEHR